MRDTLEHHKIWRLWDRAGWSRVLLVVLGGLMLAQTPACKSDEAMAKTHSGSAQDSIATSKASVENKGDAPKGLGQSCVTVKDCPSFLSCTGEVCKMPPSLNKSAQKESPKKDMPQAEFSNADGAPVASFNLELAISPDEHEKGLMYRRELPDDWGMLFIYPDEGMRSFWMQNTYISLDMIFINARGSVVNIIEEAEPLTRTPRESKRFARYVLELRGGRVAEVGLQTGDRMTLSHVDDAHDVAP